MFNFKIALSKKGFKLLYMTGTRVFMDGYYVTESESEHKRYQATLANTLSALIQPWYKMFVHKQPGLIIKLRVNDTYSSMFGVGAPAILS